MSLKIKHTFAQSCICIFTNQNLALWTSLEKLGKRAFFIFLLVLSEYTFSQNPIAGNQSFQVLSEGNFTSTNSHHIHGSLAVGGNLIINSSSLGEINMDNTGSYVFTGDGSTPTGLLVKGSITWTTGTLRVNDGNYIHIGNSTGSITSNNGGTGLTQVLPTGTSYNNAKRIEGSVNQPTNVFQTVGFDFTTLFNTYRSTSTALSTKTNNVQLYNSNNEAIAGNTVSSAQSVKINSLNFGVNYLNLTSASLNNITELSFANAAVPSADKILVINVPITANFVWNNSNMAGIAGTQGPYVLWNFYGGTTYNLTINTSSMVVGTVFAPNMNLIKTGTGDTEGGLIAKTIQLGTGEIHNYQFASDLTTFEICSGNIYDTGGNSANYADNQNYTITYTASAGNVIKLTFNSFNTEAGYDYLYIYDGPNVSSTLLYSLNGTTFPTAIVSSGSTLTLKFVSDTDVNSSGWDATISCVSPPCSCTGNLLTNNSFENGITGWSSSGGSAYNGTGYEVCGSYNGYLQATTSNAWLWQQVSATAGTTYNMSFWGGTHDPSFTHYVRLGFYNSSNTLIGSNQVNVDYDVDPNNDIAYYSFVATAPTGTSYMRVEAFANGDYIKLDQMCLSTAATGGTNTCTSPVVTASSNSPVSVGGTINLTSSSTGGSGAQLVTNGDFSNGNNSFSSDYTFGNAYNITTNPQTVWSWAVNCVNPNGNIIVGDGNGNANSRFWYQSISVTAGTTYTLSFKAYDFWGGTTAAKLQWGVNGTKTGTISNLSTGGCNTWQQISTTWTATTTGTAVFAIYNNEVSVSNNDFAIDDISIMATAPTTYTWTGPLSFTSTNQNPTLSSATTLMAGVYTVTSSVGGCTATATTSVVVNTPFSCSGNCESANLVVNPQFETDMSGWTASNGQLTRGGGGTYGSFLEVNVGDLTGIYTAYQDVTFGANAPYKFTAYVAKHGVNNLPKMYLEFYNGTTYISKTADFNVTKNYDGTFQLVNFEGNTPANTTKIRIVGWTQNNALKFDNLSLIGCQACFSIVPPASICVGQSAILTANNCSGTVIWNTGATGSTITVNPTTTTTYTATCSNTTNVLSNPNFETGNLTAWTNWNYTTITSTASEKYSGTYGAKVTASSAGGGFAQDNVAVAGESFTLKAWGKVSSTTPWSGIGVKFMNSSFTSLSDVSTEINATAFQEYTVTNTAPAGTAWVQVYAWTDASTILYLDNFSLVKNIANTTATATVTVNTAPTATATGDTECVGATITLGSTGGGTYSWTGPASFASTLQNPTRASATTAMAGVYTVTVTSANGCSATATANVIINNGTIPTATVVSTGCMGSTGSITVTNLPDGYSTNINGGAWTSYKNSYVDLAAGTYSIGYQGGGCNTYANFTVTTSTDNPLLSLAKTDPTCSTPGSITVTGSGGTTGLGDATYQLWYGITGTTVANLTSNANYPNTPSLSTLVGITEGYNNAMDNIGGRISGYIVPPTTGTYYFWVASDDYSEFWGSGDANPANKVLLASVTGYTGYREWNKYTSQKTAAVSLNAGQIYYFEVLYKEGGGGDNISLGWSKPGEATTTPSEVIPGKYLRPNVISSTTTPVYQYKIGSGTFQTSNVFTGLAAGTYTVMIQDAGGCTATTSITLSTTGGTTAPTATSTSRCGTGAVTLSASGCTGTYNWYATAAGGTSLGTGATYTTPSISTTTTYYVDCSVSTCVSSRTAATATVTSIPTAPIATGGSRCGTGTVSVSASGCAGTYNWYAVAAAGTSLGTGATFTTPSISANTTYYVDCTVNGCASSRASAVAIVNAQPAVPSGSGSRCGTGTVVLTGTGCSGIYNWYNVASGGTSLGTGATYTTPSISATTTYYVECTVGSCTSSRAAAVATINAIPTATASSNSPIVVGGTLNLFSTGGTTYSWNGPNGFNSSQQDVSSANIAALDAGVYTVTVNTNGCTAIATTQVVINTYDPGDIDCSLVSTLNFTNPTLISGTAGANNAQYRFTNVTTGTDAIVTILSRSHTDVTIVDLDIPAATYGGYDAAFQPMIDYNWINGGGSFDAAGEKSITFKFDFVQSGTTTPKTIPNLLATGLDIDGSTNEVREFIQASNYQSYQIQTPSSLTLSGALKAKGPLTTYAGINELALDAMISYAYVNPTSITVTYGGDWNGSTSDFGDTAPGNSDEKRLNSLYFKCYNFNTTVCTLPLSAPTGAGAARCGTGSVTLSASGCTGTYYWYTANAGGVAVEVGSNFSTPSLSTTTTYYVECNTVGCTSPRTAVVATVKPAVTITKTLGDSECIGNTIDLSVIASGGSGLTYNWTGPNGFSSALQNPTRNTATTAMAGTYSVTVTNSDACVATATTSVTVSNLPTSSITGITTICNGSSTTLTASGGNYYIWSNGSTSAAITVNPATTTSYSVTVYQNNVTNTSLLTNVTSFNASNFSFINATNSFAGPASLFDGVDNLTAETFHASRITTGADWGIAYNLGGSVLVTNLSVDRRNDCCTDRGEGGVMQVWNNGTMVYQSNVLNNTGDGILAATPTPNVIGTEVRYVFLAGANTLSGEGVLNFTEFIIGGTKLCAATSTTTVTVNTIPNSPTSGGGNRCGTGTLTLSASGCTGGTISWYSALTGGTALTTGATYTTPSLSSTTTYYLECSINGCISSTRSTAIATINTIPTASATGDTECVGSTITLSSSGGSVYSWNGPSSFASTLQNPTISNAQTTHGGVYTVTVTSASGCSVTATASVVVNTIPSSPTSGGGNRCGTGTLTLSASGCAGGTISWYSALTGGTALTTGATYTTPSLSSTTTYYLECSINGCISSTRSTAIATINTIPTASATGDIECLGGTISLSASGGNTYVWAGPNSFISTSATPSIANAQLSHAGTYTVTITGTGGCTASATTTVVVSSVAAPTTTGASLCGSGAVAISASGCTGTYNWYSVASGGTSIGSGDSYITPIISSSTTYYVDCTVDACVSPRASVTATILATTTATASSNSPYTSGGTLNLYGTGSGTYVWSGPNGYSSTQQNPIITNAGTDKVGTYTLTVTAANGCKAAATTYATTTTGTGIDGNSACNDPIVAGSTKINPSRTGICVGCSVTGASTVVNGNLGDYAEMTIGASIIGGGVAISVQDTLSDYPSGNYAGFTVQPVGNILSASILSGITINTYLNGTLQETATSANGLLKLSIISGYGSLQRVGLRTTKNYDEIQIIANGGLVSLLTGLRVFYAFEEPISCDKNCEQPISSASFGGSVVSSRSGISGLLCLGSVSNTGNVLDADSTNFASMSLAIGALCQSAISVKANTSFVAGTHAGYVVANASGILSLDILGNIRIETYLNGVIRESINANSSVVSVGLFNPTTNQTAISFKSSLSFDEVRIVVAGTVSLLTQLNVYYPFIRRDADGDGVPDCLDKCPNGSDLFDSNGDGVPDACTPEFPTVTIGGDTVCVGQTIYLTSNATQTELLEDNKVCNDAIVGTGVRLNPSLTGICLGCGVSSGAAVIDGDLTNYTELAIGVSIIGGGTALSVQDTMRRYPAGNYAGFVIQPVGGLLDVSVLSSITIKTYLNGVLQESATVGNSLLGVSVLSGNGGLQKVGFVTTKTYDEIQIIAGGGLASLLTALRVYYAFEEPSSCWKNCEETMKVSNFGASVVSARTGVSGLLCLGSVSNSSRLIDSDTTNYATMNLAIGLICQTAVSVKGNTTLPAGTHAGFVVENSGGLLSLSMLGNIKIETYLAGSLRESVTLNSNLVTVGLLNPNSPQTRLSIKTGQSFDEVRLVVYGTISLLSQLNVYYSFIRRDADSDGIPNCMDKCTGTDLTDTDGDGTPDACDATNTSLLTYSWTGPGGFTSNLQSPTRPSATTTMGGIYTLTITNSSGYVRTLTTNVIVSAYPVISATPSSVCAGGTISMTVSGAITYTWTGPGGFTSNEIIITRANATTAMAGTYTIVASNYNTCNSTSTVAVTVNNLPNAPVVANAARCDVGAITITATGCSGGTIKWYASQTGTTMLASGASYSIASLSNSAVYFTSCTDANACVSSSRSYGVAAVNPIPDATLTGVGSLCLGYQPTNSGKLVLTKFKSTDTFSYNIGSSYNSGTASAFAAIPINGEVLTGISDPNTTITYTVRIKNTENCTIDRNITLTNQCSACPAGYCEPSTVVKTK